MQTGICVPAAALTRPLMKRIIALSGIDRLDSSAATYLDMLEQDFMERMFRLKGAPVHIQESLFGDTAGGGQASLL